MYFDESTLETFATRCVFLVSLVISFELITELDLYVGVELLVRRIELQW